MLPGYWTADPLRPELLRLSFHPMRTQGLSHYLEHMLFMGSEKFPDENDYDAFLASHGGASNAYTELVSILVY